jgi:glycosyltransferase involved in cell wall biosynthesis
MKSNEIVDIMMVTYNRLDLTKETLDCLIKNTQYPFKLIVIDNNSTDGTGEYLFDFLSNNIQEDDGSPPKGLQGFTLKTNKENKGIAIGRNQALLRSKSNWLCTIDNDVFVPNGWLAECIDILKKNRQYAAIGVNMEGVSYPLTTINGKEFQNKAQGNLGTACMVFNRSLHKMIGFFNWKDYKGEGAVTHYAMEDSDYGMRIRVLGLKLGYIKGMGKHLGEGERDVGEYRDLKTKAHKKNLPKFNANCRAYMRRDKKLYISFTEQDE